MLKKFFLGILAFSIMQLLSPATIVSQDNTIGKIIFAYTQIKKGGSADLLQQSHFFTTEKIYARAFLKDKFGTLGVEEFGMVDLWIDEVFIKRFVFSNYDLSPSGKEMRLYVHNTGKDDFEFIKTRNGTFVNETVPATNLLLLSILESGLIKV